MRGSARVYDARMAQFVPKNRKIVHIIGARGSQDLLLSTVHKSLLCHSRLYALGLLGHSWDCPSSDYFKVGLSAFRCFDSEVFIFLLVKFWKNQVIFTVRLVQKHSFVFFVTEGIRF